MLHSTSRLVLAILAALLSLQLPALAGKVWTVSDSGNADFTDIQAAVDAASDGDAVLIKTGDYRGFIVTDKTLVISADLGATVSTKFVRVENLSAHKRVVLARLLAGAQSAMGNGLTTEDCAGSVRVVECELHGGRRPTPVIESGAGARIHNSADVTFSNCSLRGFDRIGSYFAGHGLWSTASKVAVYDSACVGGTGIHSNGDITAPSGGHGALLQDGGEFFASSSSFVGGRGSGNWVTCGYPGDGGDGLCTENVTCRVVLAVATGGPGGSCVSCSFVQCYMQGTPGQPFSGNVVTLDAPRRLALAEPLVRAGLQVPFNFEGPPDSRVQLLVSNASAYEYQAGDPGVFHLAPPLLALPSTFTGGLASPGIPLVLPGRDLRTIGADGTLQVSLPSITLPPGEESQLVSLQALLITPAGERALSAPLEVLLTACDTDLADCNANNIPDACDVQAGTSQDCNGNLILDECEWSDCNSNGVLDICDIQQGTSTDCDGDGEPDECHATDCNGNGITDACDIAHGTSGDSNSNGIPDECEPSHVYVDPSAPAGGDGRDWAHALNDLHTALSPTSLATTVWVRGGTYRTLPGQAFRMTHPMEVYGGFAGHETSLTERIPGLFPTVLSGDVLGNDLPDFINRGDNTQTVIKVDTNQPAPCRLDGFTISGGHAAPTFYSWGYDDPRHSGAGLHYSGRNGGGPLELVNCTFTDNLAWRAGAGVLATHGELRITSCDFINNSVEFASALTGIYMGGAGVFAFKASLEITNSVFAGNRVTRPGAHTTLHGGAILLYNPSDYYGPVGGLTLELRDSTLWSNSSSYAGGGISCLSSLPLHIRIFNTILLDNAANGVVDEFAQLDVGSMPTTIGYCDIDGLTTFAGPGNFASDPAFVNPLGPDGQAGTLDDDLRLSASSPCVDAGRNAHLPEDGADLDLDGDLIEQLPQDLLGRPRRLDDPTVVDTGAGNVPITDVGAIERDPSVDP